MNTFSLSFFLSSFVDTIANIYLAEKKLDIANWSIDGKNNILHKCVHSEENSAMETVILNKF